MLTSGTTGTPKGAVRTINPRSLAPLAVAGLLDLARIKPAPRSGEPVLVAPPLFHLYGMIGLAAAFGFGSPIVIRRRFDPEATLDQIERTRRRRAARGTDDARADHAPASDDAWSLRRVLAADDRQRSGAARSGARARDHGRVRRRPLQRLRVDRGRLGHARDARATCAPRPAPSAGRSAGIRIKILDDDGHELPAERHRPDLRRQPVAVRGLYRRRRQGDHRRADEHRRRRPLRSAADDCSSTAATTT